MINEKFWLAIAFVVFVILFIKLAGSKIAKILDQKSKQIAEEISAAKELREKAAKLLASAETYHKESLSYSDKLKQDAESEAKKFLIAAENSIKEELDKKTVAAYERLSREETQTLRKIKSEIISSALKIIEEDIAKTLDKKQSDTVFSKATQDLGKIIH